MKCTDEHAMLVEVAPERTLDDRKEHNIRTLTHAIQFIE